MIDIVIKRLSSKNNVPYELLLLADPSIDSIKDYISRGILHAAYVNNSIVGICVLIKTRPLTFEIANIAIDELYQGKGIGKNLLFAVVDTAIKEGAKILEVGTGNSSIDQLGFYQRCGFRFSSIERDFFKTHYKNKIIENGIECVDMIRLNMYL
ncbi:GNAT family N-acetyltransferase [Clostridium rectalis]|uniref:GNAT family N-acetyltransferase n=1 Tax=Clostridium rectalis TaxID=2040295 RepID=UPI000F630B51|nr:GNAT family N-acetyltransferase [Clostridium rectalis]